jgi:hypothetical protein
MTQNAVRELLKAFQSGYAARDVTKIDEFMELFGSTNDVEAIGTKGSFSGEKEWRVGRVAVRDLIEDDWRGWGDVVFDVDGAWIRVHDDVAWLSCSATATLRIPFDNISDGFLAETKNTLDDETLSPDEKMSKITRLGSDIYFEMPRGERFVWPFRFTAVAVKESTGWCFRQVQFSYSNTRMPDVRLSSADVA